MFCTVLAPGSHTYRNPDENKIHVFKFERYLGTQTISCGARGPDYFNILGWFTLVYTSLTLVIVMGLFTC